ncbi:unnamed protein product [Protopolystoma xenopodis]|uniref:Uncharacterized protein n=1 Tax=Protopolystoma xenopodis TaxID=117903 RepID=A0A3S5AVX8_9PLAT|nr:unnamed protein product [Protopolystoma xenopodis]
MSWRRCKKMARLGSRWEEGEEHVSKWEFDTNNTPIWIQTGLVCERRPVKAFQKVHTSHPGRRGLQMGNVPKSRSKQTGCAKE